MLDRKSPPSQRSMYQKLGNRLRSIDLRLHTLLNDIPDLGHTHHVRGFEFLKCSNRVRSLHSQSLRVSITDFTTSGEHRVFCHKFHNVREGEVGEVHTTRNNFQTVHTGCDGSHNLSVGDDDSLGFSSGSRGVHEYRHGIRFGRCGWERDDVTGFDKVFKGYNVHTNDFGLEAGEGNVILDGTDEVFGEDDGLETGHLTTTCKDGFDIALVTDNRGDDTVLDGINHGVHTEGRVDGGHDDGLGKGTLCGNHPLRAGILKDGEGTRSRNRVQRRFFRSRDESSLLECCTELHDFLTDLLVGPPGDPVEFPYGWFFGVPSLVVSGSHAFECGVGLDAVLGDFVEGFLAAFEFGQGGFALTVGSDAVGWIVSDGNGSDGCLLEQGQEGFDPSEGYDGDLWDGDGDGWIVNQSHDKAGSGK